MPLPLIAAAALTLGPELMKIGSGISQKIKAKKLGKGLKRPEYKVPGSIREAVSNARIAAINPEFAGQRALESKLSASTSAGISRMKEASSSGTEILNAVSALQGKETEGIRDIGIAAEQAQAQDMANLNQSLSNQARFEDKAFDINKMDPFKEQAAAAAALKEAGAKNIYSGISGIGAGAQMLAGGGVPGSNGEGAAEGLATPTSSAPTETSGAVNAFSNMSEEELRMMKSKLGLF